ncbi:MAG: sugar ABC transporter substrate-binding protein [Cyanobacteria bacterium P01_H01_bin.15]
MACKFKHRWGSWLLVGLLGSGLISCQKRPQASSETDIEFWTMQLQPEFTDYFNDLITTYETDKTVEITWVDVPWSAMESKILTAVSASTAPDVVNLNPDFASQLAARDAWLNLNDIVSTETRDRYLPNIWLANQYEEQSFGLPWYLTTNITIYNQDILSEADVSVPSNYSELAATARDIKERTGKYGFFITFVPEDTGDVLQSLVQMGVQLIDKDGQAAFDTEAGRKAFQYWVDLYQAELLPPEVLTQGHRYGIELYQSGQTALLSTGAEFLGTIQRNAPSVGAVSAAAPQITGKTGKKNVAVMNLTIPKSSKSPTESLDFALFVTNSENQLAFAKAANVLPSTKEGLQLYQAELTEAGGSDPLSSARRISAEQLPETEVLIPVIRNLPELQRIIYENLQAAMLGQKSTEQAVSDAAATWNAMSNP